MRSVGICFVLEMVMLWFLLEEVMFRYVEDWAITEILRDEKFRKELY